MDVVVRGPYQLAFTASSPEDYLDTQLADHPMAIAAFKVLGDRGAAEAGRDRLLEVVRAENEDPRRFRSTARYIVLLGRPTGAPPN
jgi:hypothetical protein